MFLFINLTIVCVHIDHLFIEFILYWYSTCNTGIKLQTENCSNLNSENKCDGSKILKKSLKHKKFTPK